MKKEKVTTLISCNAHWKFHRDEDLGPEGWTGVRWAGRKEEEQEDARYEAGAVWTEETEKQDWGTDSSSWDWKAAQQSWSMYLGRWRVGRGRGRKEEIAIQYRPWKYIKWHVKEFGFGGTGVH